MSEEKVLYYIQGDHRDDVLYYVQDDYTPSFKGGNYYFLKLFLADFKDKRPATLGVYTTHKDRLRHEVGRNEEEHFPLHFALNCTKINHFAYRKNNLSSKVRN